jgi:hypothetical protein
VSRVTNVLQTTQHMCTELKTRQRAKEQCPRIREAIDAGNGENSSQTHFNVLLPLRTWFICHPPKPRGDPAPCHSHGSAQRSRLQERKSTWIGYRPFLPTAVRCGPLFGKLFGQAFNALRALTWVTVVGETTVLSWLRRMSRWPCGFKSQPIPAASQGTAFSAVMQSFCFPPRLAF